MGPNAVLQDSLLAKVPNGNSFGVRSVLSCVVLPTPEDLLY